MTSEETIKPMTVEELLHATLTIYSTEVVATLMQKKGVDLRGGNILG